MSQVTQRRAGTAVGRSTGANVLLYLSSGIFIAVGFCFFAFLAILLFGSRAGAEISADTFSRRDYWFIEEPISGTQVFPITRESTTGALESYLQTGKLLKPPATPTGRWDLYRAAPQPDNPNHLDSQILVSYLEMMDASGDLVWLKWSRRHPHLAKILWPHVGQLAREQLYVMLPELFSTAAAHSPPPGLPTKKPSPGDGVAAVDDGALFDFDSADDDDGSEEENTSDNNTGTKATKDKPPATPAIETEKQKKQSAAFSKALNQHLSQAYAKLASYRQALNEHQQAVDYYDRALELNSANTAAVKARAAAVKALGESTTAKSSTAGEAAPPATENPQKAAP